MDEDLKSRITLHEVSSVTPFAGSSYCPSCGHTFGQELARCPDCRALLSAIDPDPLRGSDLSNQYQIVELLGVGGLGIVYKALQVSLDRYMKHSITVRS